MIMPKKADQAMQELHRRWQAIFSLLASGGEVSPGLRLRTEGMMETLALLDLYSIEQLQQEMAACYSSCESRPLPPDWSELFPFPQIPGFGQRAPVYPSTSD